MSQSKKNKPFSKLHISIGVAPTPGLDLTHELNLIKVALLYADKATLCSPKALMFASMASLANANLKEKIEFMAQVIPVLQPDQAVDSLPVLEQLRKISKKRIRSKNEILFQKKFENYLNNSWETLSEKISEIIESADGSNGLADALMSGHIKLKVIGKNNMDNLVEDFIEYVSDSVKNGDTHPLLDEVTGNFVNAGIREGKIEVTQKAIERSKQVHLASDLFARLPLFEAATVSEILDIRNDLEKYLVRFRSGMMKLSSSIVTASWDKDFPIDVEDIVRKEIEPAIQDIEEEIQNNKYLLEVVRKIVDKPLLVSSGSLLGIAVANFSELSGIVSQSFGVGTAGLLASIDAHRTWKSKRQEIEKNLLYFYYKCQKTMN